MPRSFTAPNGITLDAKGIAEGRRFLYQLFRAASVTHLFAMMYGYTAAAQNYPENAADYAACYRSARYWLLRKI